MQQPKETVPYHLPFNPTSYKITTHSQRYRIHRGYSYKHILKNKAFLPSHSLPELKKTPNEIQQKTTKQQNKTQTPPTAPKKPPQTAKKLPTKHNQPNKNNKTKNPEQLMLIKTELYCLESELNQEKIFNYFEQSKPN